MVPPGRSIQVYSAHLAESAFYGPFHPGNVKFELGEPALVDEPDRY